MKWVDIENIKIDESVNSIVVDTRDFKAIDLSTPKIGVKIAQRIKTNDSHLIKSDEIHRWLGYLKNITGGEWRWRYMSFSNVDGERWIKYLRLYRINKNSFLVCNDYNEPLEWRLMKEDSLQKKYLHCHN